MAKIPQQEIDQLKQSISLVRLAESYNIKLKKHGKDDIGLCPFHNDKEPSLIISPDKNLWHCLGACNEGGSVIEFIMKIEGVSFRHAVELLQNGLPHLAAGLKKEVKPVKHASSRKLPTEFDGIKDSQALVNRVIDYYHNTLKQNYESLAYLSKRGLNNPELIDHFKLGFANRTLAYRLPIKKTKSGFEIRELLQGAGILRSSGHEHFNGSVIIPVIDEKGDVTEAYGRKITYNLRKGTPDHLYLPGQHQGVFNIGAFKASEEMILCESLIDALTFWVNGYRNVTASYGIGGFTPDILAAFKQHEIKRVLIAYDRDQAGIKAAEDLAEKLIKEGFECYQVILPMDMDVNEVAQQCVLDPQQGLGDFLRAAEWMGKGQAPVKIDIQPIIVEPSINKPINHQNEIEPAETTTPEAPIDFSFLAADTEPKVTPEAMPEVEEVISPDAPVSELVTASPLPKPPEDIKAEIKGHEIMINMGDRQYKIRGLDKNTGYQQLKVNITISREALFHVDTVDMRLAKSRYVFIKQAAIELCYSEDVIKRDFSKIYLKLEALQDQQIKHAKQNDQNIKINDQDKKAAIDFLKSGDLLSRILYDFDQCGIVGEKINKLVGYLACVSRKLDKPLAVVIQSSSAAGKSSLMDAVLDFMPEEERVQYSAMTGQSLFYMGESELKHKILAIAEEEGIRQAAYSLKLLQSQGVVTIASTGKDEKTGELRTVPYKVEGPVMLFMTTTATDVDEELMNRCMILTVNETIEQTQAIHDLQRFGETLEGLMINEHYDEIIKRHHNAQRLLRPLKVVNPFAKYLTFASNQTRMRRDHQKYLTLIRSVALLHQYQREIKTVKIEQGHGAREVEYIEVTLSDIEIANCLANEVLGRSLDELPPQTRRLLQLIYNMVLERCQTLKIAQKDYRFSRKDIRLFTHWGNTQLKTHLNRLEDFEYLLVHQGGRGKSMVYELGYKGEGCDGQPFSMGLIDVSKLRHDSEKSGFGGQKSGVNGQKSAVSDKNQEKQEKQVTQDKLVSSYHRHTDTVVQ